MGRFSTLRTTTSPVGGGRKVELSSVSRSRVSRFHRCREYGRQVTTLQHGRALQNILHQLGRKSVVQQQRIATYDRGRYGYEVPRLSYNNIRTVTERRLTHQKRGILTEEEIKNIAKDIEDRHKEEDCN